MFVREGMLEKKKGKNEMKGKVNGIKWSKIILKIGS
jgi:hypothetical protein